MAKIQELQIDTDKIDTDAVTAFFTRSSTTSITVNNPYGIPTLIWLKTYGAVNLTRSSDSKVIFSSSGAVVTYAIDVDPPVGSETYTSSVAEIVGAMVSLR